MNTKAKEIFKQQMKKHICENQDKIIIDLMNSVLEHRKQEKRTHETIQNLEELIDETIVEKDQQLQDCEKDLDAFNDDE